MAAASRAACPTLAVVGRRHLEQPAASPQTTRIGMPSAEATFVFRTAMNVQGFVSEDRSGQRDDAFLEVKCHPGGSAHFVNPKADDLRSDEETRGYASSKLR